MTDAEQLTPVRHANQAGFEERSTLQRSSHSVHTTLTVVQPVHCASLTHTLGVVTKHILRMLASYFVSLSVLLCLHCQPQVHSKKKKKYTMQSISQNVASRPIGFLLQPKRGYFCLKKYLNSSRDTTPQGLSLEK